MQTIEPPTIEAIIDYMEATAEDAWGLDVVRSKDGTRNCFFGHLFAMGGNDDAGNVYWNTFEEFWATTYMVYPVNDGQNPAYPQATPKQRVLAYLRDLRDGKAMTTMQCMEADWLASEACESASPAGES